MSSDQLRASLWADLFFAAGVLVALCVLAGWSFDIPALRDFNVGHYPTWPITAAANLSLSIALLSIDRVPEPARRVLLLVPMCIAMIALAEDVTGASTGFDRLLIPQRLDNYALSHPGRPGLIPSISLLVMVWAGWRANAVQRQGGTVLFLHGCAMIGLAAMSFSLLLLLGESGLAEQPSRVAASLPVTLMLLSQAGGLLIWLIKHQRGLPWSRGGWMRPINFVLIAVLVLPAILLPLHLKIAQLGWLPKLSAEILGSVLNLLIVVALLGWAIERMAREQALLEQRESALDASRAQLESILATVPDAMIVIDDHGRIQRFSAAAERLFGYRAEETIGRDVAMLMTEADRREDHLAHYRATGERRVIGHIRAFKACRADGVEIPIELSVGETRIDGNRIFTGFVRDISDRVAAEGHMEQLRAEYAHSARRSAMGEMAAALAHELNQPLAAAGNFLGAAEVILEQSGADHPATEMLGRASTQLVRAGEIIRRLRDFMIGRDVELHVEDLAQIVADAAAIAFVGLPPVEVSYDIAREARMIFADRVQTQQVLVNILRNAAEAMRELAPELRRIVLVAGPAEGDMAEICVVDTGPGFPRKLLDNMRVPFLSTKAGRGMGVGLSISRRIVEAHGGRFTARNGPSGGGMVCFTLPLDRSEGGV